MENRSKATITLNGNLPSASTIYTKPSDSTINKSKTFSSP